MQFLFDECYLDVYYVSVCIITSVGKTMLTFIYEYFLLSMFVFIFILVLILFLVFCFLFFTFSAIRHCY